MDIEEVKKEISKILKEELPQSFGAFFFGSRVTGTASERSDLDVGIESPDGKTLPSDVLSKIKNRCEALPTLYMIDVVDFANISKDFRKVAKTKIEIIIQ